MITRTMRIEKALNQYSCKWGMDRYRFYCYQPNDTLIYVCEKHVSYSDCELTPSRGYYEIKSVATLLKRIRTCRGVKLYCGMIDRYEKAWMSFESFDEFKTHTMIEKLGFMNYD